MLPPVSPKRRSVIDRQVLSPLDLRSEEHTSELQSQSNLVCRLLLEKKKKKNTSQISSIFYITTFRRHSSSYFTTSVLSFSRNRLPHILSEDATYYDAVLFYSSSHTT